MGGYKLNLLDIYLQKNGKKLSSKDADQKKIESQVRKYKIKRINENELLLYLRQLDY